MKRHHTKTWIALMLALQLLFTSGWTAFAWPDMEEEKDFVYLSDMTPQSASVGYDCLRLAEANMGGGLTLLEGEWPAYYSAGMLAYAPSELVYNIEGLAATRFTALCGISPLDNATGSCAFVVKIDDLQQLKIPDMIVTSGGYQVDITIPAGAKKLTLTALPVQGGKRGDDNCPAVWIEPKLYLPDANPVTSLSLDGRQSILPVGSTDTFLVRGTRLDGSVSYLTSDVTFQIDNPDVASVDAQGKVTALAPGKATVTVSYPVNDVLRTTTCPVVVPQTDSFWKVDFFNQPQTSVLLGLDEDGTLYHQANLSNGAIVAPSLLGIKTSLGDFSSGLTFQSVTSKQVEETYPLPSNRDSTYIDTYQEAVFTFIKGEALLRLHLRVYNQGYAFRYIVEKQDGSSGAMTISEETSTFVLPGGSELLSMEHTDEDNAFYYGADFTQKKMEGIKKVQAMPLRYQTPGLVESGNQILVSEANLYGDPYCGSFLRPVGGNMLQTVWDSTQTEDVQTVYPFTSPWRFAVGGWPEGGMEDVLGEPNTDDVSWVQPGAAFWAKLTGGDSVEQDRDTLLRHIGFASELGWKYFIFDKGWQPEAPNGGDILARGYYEWFDEVSDYAESMGVGLIAWIQADDLDTPAKREILKEYAEKGIVGIKVDSFRGENQQSIQLYKDIYEACYQNRLVVSVHDANKSTGEKRTYPNILNREAVSDSTGAYQTVLRSSLLGTVSVSAEARSSKATTAGYRLAMHFMGESNMPCMTGSIEEYESSPGLPLLKDLSSDWERMEGLPGKMGEYTTQVRRSGDALYIAAVAHKAQYIKIPLYSLEGGVYTAVIYEDSKIRDKLEVTIQPAYRQVPLDIYLQHGGGCVIKLVPAEKSSVEAISLPESITVTAEEGMWLTPKFTPSSPTLTDLNWSSGNRQVATVVNGLVTGLDSGQTVITASSPMNPNITAQCVVNVVNPSHRMADGWVLEHPSDEADRPQFDPDNPCRTTLKTLKGETKNWGSAQNMLLREAPEGDFTMTLKVSGSFSKDQQGVALALYAKSNLVFSMKRKFRSGSGGNRFELLDWYPVGDPVQYTASDSRKDDDAYLKLERKRNVLIGSYSYDNVHWTPIKKTIIESSLGDNFWDLKIGVYALSGQFIDAVTDVTVEDFTVNGEIIPFSQHDDGKTIVSATPAEISAPAGTSFEALGLPGEIAVYLTGGQTLQLPVVWQKGSYDGDIPDTYTLTGVIEGGESAVNPRGVTASVAVKVGSAVNIRLLAPEIVKDRPFQLQLSDSVSRGKLTLVNELGRKLGHTVISRQVDGEGWKSVLSLSLGTVRKNAVIKVYEGDVCLGAFRFEVQKEQRTGVYALGAPDSAEVNQPFQVGVLSTPDLIKGKFFNESDKVIGSTIVVREMTPYSLITTYELKVGTVGHREIIFRSTYDKSEDWGFDWDFDIRITPRQ